MKSALKMLLKIEKEQEQLLDSQSKISNWLYNQLLERANQLKSEYLNSQNEKITQTLYSKRGLRNLIPGLKEEYPFLKSVYSSPLKNVGLRLSLAIREYQNSKKGNRKGKKVGWPKFKKWKRDWFSLQYDEPFKGYKIKENTLQLQLGVDESKKRLSVELPFNETFPLKEKATIKQLRITKENGLYFAVFTIDKEEKELKTPTKVIALDPNHKNLAYGVDLEGNAIEILNFSPLRKMEKRIDLLKSRRAHCKKNSKLVEYQREDGSIHRHYEPSRRWTFFNKLLEKEYQKRREQTKVFLFTVANKLCKEYDVISIGDYTPQGGGLSTAMRRVMNNYSLIARFKSVLTWVALRSGKRVHIYNETGTTRTCHLCRYKFEDGLSPQIREWTCPQCQKFHIRDENAAQNGLVVTFEDLKNLNLPCSGHTPVNIQVRWVWQVTASGVSASRGC